MKLVRNILGVTIASVFSISGYAATAQAAQSSTVAVGAQAAPATTTAQTASVQNTAAQAALQQQIQQLQGQINQLQNSINTASTATGVYNPGGLHVLLDASDNVLFETFPSANNFSLAVMQAKNTFQNGDLVFGGYVEQDTQYWDGDQIASSTGTYENGTQISLTSAKLDAMANINSWATSFVSLSASNLSPTSSSTSNTMELEKAFLLLGNLNKSPIYGVLGKTYLPFGTFGGGGPWTAPLDKMYFRPDETTQADLSYFKNGLNTNLAIFNNNSGLNSTANYANDFAYSLNYSQTQGKWDYNMGAGYLNDLRGTSTGIGSIDSGTRNYAVDLNAGVGYGLYALSAEFVQGSNPVAGNSGKPAAWNFTGTYSPILAGKLTLFSLSRDMTTQLANVPVGFAGNAVPGSSANSGLRSQWVATVDREFFPNIFIGLELETAKTYTAQNTHTATIDVSAYF